MKSTTAVRPSREYAGRLASDIPAGFRELRSESSISVDLAQVPHKYVRVGRVITDEDETLRSGVAPRQIHPDFGTRTFFSRIRRVLEPINMGESKSRHIAEYDLALFHASATGRRIEVLVVDQIREDDVKEIVVGVWPIAAALPIPQILRAAESIQR